MIKVLELFAGSRSFSKAAEEVGYKTFTTDIEPFDGIDHVCNIFDLDPEHVAFIPDVIWASPPCQGFSVAAIGKNWVKGEPFTPKTPSAQLGIDILERTLAIIGFYMLHNPRLVFFIENPRGKMRKSPLLQPTNNMLRHTITYCQYGDERMKPTDIWTNSKSWTPKPPCKNGDPCHVSAPRGSQTGTQGLKGDYLRSQIPHELCLEIIKSISNEK